MYTWFRLKKKKKKKKKIVKTQLNADDTIKYVSIDWFST